MRQIYGLGESVYDIIFRNGQPQRAVAGGSTFNTIISLGRCSLAPTMVTETGDDYVGDIIVRFMRDNGVVTEFVTINHGRKTPLSLAFLDERNDAHYQFYKDVGTSFAQRPFPDFKADDIVVFGSFYAVNPTLRAYTREFIRRAHDAGAVLYYDVNLRPAHKGDLPQVLSNIEENIRWATIVRASHEDLACVYGEHTPEASATAHVKALCRNLIVTHGAAGATFYSPTLTCHFDTPSIPTVSTIGAGDNFNAGVIHSIVTEQWTAARLSDPTAEILSTMNDRAQRFAADVCQSIENYVSPAFASSIGGGA